MHNWGIVYGRWATFPVHLLHIFLRLTASGRWDCSSVCGSYSVCTIAGFCVCFVTVMLRLHCEDWQYRGNRVHIIALYLPLAWCWIQLELKSSRPMMVNILFISKLVEDLLCEVDVTQSLPWNMCASLDACNVASFLPRRMLLASLSLVLQSLQAFRPSSPSCSWTHWSD